MCRQGQEGVIIANTVILALLVTALAALVVGLRRINELFAFRICRGVLLVVRGNPPARLLADLRDVVAETPPLQRGDVRIVIENRRPMVRASTDVPPPRVQRLRNVIGLWPLAKLRNR